MSNDTLTRRARILYGILITLFIYTLLYLFFLFYPFLSDKMDMSDIDVKGDATFYCEDCYPKPSIKDSKHWHNLITKMLK